MKQILKDLQTIFIRGLVLFLPIALAIYIIYSCISLMENLLGTALRALLPQYVTGLGFVVTVLLIFTFGLLVNNLITSSLVKNLERVLTEIPFFKAVYLPLRDLMNLFSKGQEKGLRSVVIVKLHPQGFGILGIVTRDNFNDIKQVAPLLTENVAVYIPLSYSVGGLTVLVPKENITPVDMSVERAMSLAITGWVKSEKQEAMQ